MATVLEEEDLIAQAQKRERARLEEEARILAFQQQQQAALPPPVWAGSPEVVIDQFNAQPGAVGAPTLIGSDQYQNELARAARGSGYVAADVGPMGNVITGAYDPSIDPLRIAAEKEATNFQRQQLYGQLLRGGATAAEAFRFANSRHPDIKAAPGMIRAEALASRRQPIQPEIQTIDGVRVMRTGPNSFARIPETRSATAKPPVVPLDVTASQKILSGQITQTRNDLERAKKAAETDPGDVDAARRARIYQEQLRGLEGQFQQGSTNWMGSTAPPASSSAPFKEGAIVRNKQNGKRYKIVNGEPVAL